MFQLDLQSRVPIYEQMKKKIIELVMTGVLSIGEQLPSVRSLAREVGVNPNTVQKAYQELEREGIIVTIGGKGSFIAQFTEKENPLIQQAKNSLRTAAAQAYMSGIPLEDAQEVVIQSYREGFK